MQAKKINKFDYYFISLDIMNRKARLAWELYLKMETSGESFSLLQLIANDCYKVSYNLYSKNNRGGVMAVIVW